MITARPGRGDALRRAIETLCPDVDAEVRQNFLDRIDTQYRARHPPETIAIHLRMAARLDADNPVDCHIKPLNDGFEIAIVAFDYFSEFSILCGLLASFGLDIQSGQVQTLSARDPGPQSGLRSRRLRPRRSRNTIVDVFRVLVSEGVTFDGAAQESFREELRALIALLERGQTADARARVNRRVVETLAKTRTAFMGRLSPMAVTFENRASSAWTVMDIRGKDTPAFLYAFSNALALRGIYVHGVLIDKVGAEVRDRFLLHDARGRKIETKREQDLLRVASVMIKQFTHSLAAAPDPSRAVLAFDLLLDKLMERGSTRSLSFLKQDDVRDLLARLLGSSEFLWEDFLRLQVDNLLPVLRASKPATGPRSKNALRTRLRRAVARGRTLEQQTDMLNRTKDREMFRIDMAHFLGRSDRLLAFSRALTDLADVVLEEALRIARRTLTRRYGKPLLDDGAPCLFAVCGLGKFGGREMGYASDIEILCVYGGPGRTRGPEPVDNSVYFEQLVQALRDCIRTRQEGIFHLDLRLRPHGGSGPLASSLEQVRHYYRPSGGAAPFERQALIKLRWVAGDERLGRQVEVHRDGFVYSAQPWDLGAAVELRQRQIKELVQPGTTNVKYGPGGVIDVEYAVQYLQVMHGKAHRELRTSSTLEALEGLRRVGLVSRTERDDLRGAYLFLRALIDGLRIVRGNARDLVLPEPGSDDMKFLARRLGYTGADWDREAERLETAIRRQMATAHRFFATRFGDGRDVLRNAALTMGDMRGASKSVRKT